MGRRAPRTDRFMCIAEVAVATDVRGHDDLAGRGLGADYFACALKTSNDLHAEVNNQCNFARSGVMVKETVMTISAQALMEAKKIPDKIKRGLPDFPNFPDWNAAPHCGKRLRADGPGYNVIVHRQLFFELIRPVTPTNPRSSLHRTD